MGTGYTRNDTPNNIADGNVINASDLDGEFDAVQAAFNGSTGHSHDGTTGEGPQIATAGLADNAVTTAKITDANVTTAKINNGAVTSAKLDTNIAIAGTLGVTGVSSFANGSNSAPSLTFTSDTNTGIYRGGTDILKFVTAGTDAITIDASQNVTIGNNLSITGNGSTSDLTGSNIFRIMGDDVRITNSAGSEAMATSTADGAVTLYHNNAQKFITTANGFNLGDATASVYTDFNILGASTSNYGAYLGFMSGGTAFGKIARYGRIQGGTSDDFFITTGTTNNLLFGINNVEKARIDSSGNVGIGTSSPVNNSNRTTLALEDTWGGQLDIMVGSTVHSSFGTDNFSSGLSCRIESQDGFTFKTTAGAGELVRITSTGLVGIGETGPLGKLHIKEGDSGVTSVSTDADQLVIENNAESGISILAPTNSASRIAFGDSDNNKIGQIYYNHSSNFMKFDVNNAEAIRITSAGNVGIGNSNPEDFGSLVDNLVVGTTSGENGITIASGTANGGRIQFADNTSSPFRGAFEYDHSTDSMFVYTAGTQRMRIDSSGNLIKIGGVITGERGTAAAPAYSFSDDTDTGMFNDANAHLGFSVGGTERMRITSAGAMTMGTSTSQTAVSGITLRNDVQSSFPTLLFLQNQPGTGGTMGADIHMGYASDYGSILRFYGNPFSRRQGGFEFRRVTGSGTSDLSMRINEDGNVGIGDSSNIARLMVESNFSSYTGVNVKNNNSSPSGVFINFTNYQGTQAGSISHNGSTSVGYNTSSDHRLKENVVDMTGAIDRVKLLSPKRFNFIADDTDTLVDGFLAHEAQTVVSEAVTGTHNEVDDDGNAVMQGIDQSKLVPLLTGALKEAISKIEDLEARIVALETA